MVVFPNAKINIGLDIISKRSDGFHNIESIFYPIPLYDILEVVKDGSKNKIQFNSSGIHIPGNSQSNLCIKAYELLKDELGMLDSVRCHLHKIIPIGAGLGGGSADGAFFLMAINKLLALDLSLEKLKLISNNLGSDCPFFIENIPSFVCGVGDVLRDIPLSLSGYHLVLINPGIHISTKEAYGGVKIGEKDMNLLDFMLKHSPNKWKDRVQNNFEESIFRTHPELLDIKHKLYSLGAEYTSMSGSGSSIYGLFKEKAPNPKEIFPEFQSWKLSLS